MDIRREALGRRLDAEQTRSLLDGLVRAGWLKLVTTKTDGRAIHRWQVNPLLFSGAPNARKARKVRKGVRVMTLSTFPTFLTFLAQALCFPVPASDPWQGLEIPSYPRRERLGPQTVPSQ